MGKHIHTLKSPEVWSPSSFVCQGCELEFACSTKPKGRNYRHMYCCNKCQMEAKRRKRIRQWLEEGRGWNIYTPKWAKDYLITQRGYACEVCSISMWQGQKIPLEFDHVDGNYMNNAPSNLRMVCPNCHSLTPTFKGKNKGSGREYRRLRDAEIARRIKLAEAIVV